MSKFKGGDRIVLKAVPEEGWLEEHGVFIEYEQGYPSMCCVRVDRTHRAGPRDDGIRETETCYVSREPEHA